MMPPMMGGARWFLYRVSAFFLRPYGGISTGPRAPRISSLGRDASGGTKNNSAALNEKNPEAEGAGVRGCGAVMF